MEHTVTERGFKHMEPIQCSYGFTVSVYESSAASGPHIWVRIHEEFGTIHSSGGMTAHLSLIEAEHLRDQLDWLIHNHYQVSDE